MSPMSFVWKRDCHSAISRHTGHAVFPRNPSGSERLPLQETAPRLDASQKSDAPITAPPQVSHLGTCLALTQGIRPVEAAHQSWAQTDWPPVIPDASQASSSDQQLPHFDSTFVNKAQNLLEQTAFLDMGDRYKLITPADPNTIDQLADDLSALIDAGIIAAFNQVSVHGQPVFTVAFR